jgi:hypothetical protein
MDGRDAVHRLVRANPIIGEEHPMKRLFVIALSCFAVSLAALGVSVVAFGQQTTPAPSATTTASPKTPAATPTSAKEQKYHATLSPANDSGVTGTASITVSGGKLTIEVQAAGLEPGRVHEQHIHQRTDGTAATCPGIGADKDGDGIVSLQEAEAVAGPVALPLIQSTYPTANSDNKVMYANQFQVNIVPANATPQRTASAVAAAKTLTPEPHGTETAVAQTTKTAVTGTETAVGTNGPETPSPEQRTVASDEGTPVAPPLTLTKDVIEIHGMTVKGQYDATVPVACGTIGSGGAAPGTPVAEQTAPGSPTPQTTPGAGGGAAGTSESTSGTSTAGGTSSAPTPTIAAGNNNGTGH